ncbi:HAD family hydrolase [Clostridium luticellarii]|uniref:5'-nucleotidase n=1 Tax=Clostridium luticellarii TaxID=1691940 RepID=A0A2T0BSM6_9CLOT|nr:HAD family hydrolase [Clostridium luticellarii]PRR86869.1 5'-nucleotidase [Clostridium luticellarii]
MKYKYILFDLDGTLTDSKEGITKSVQYALRKYHISVKNLNSLENFIGPPLKDSFMQYYNFNEGQAIKAVEYYRENFKTKGIFQNRVYENIENLLKKLKNLNLSLMVATSKPTVFAKKILNHFNLSEYFDDIVGSGLDGTRGKKGEVIKYIIDKHDIEDTDKAVMIGDRRYDALGAAQNGVDCIGVAYGYGSVEELKNAGAAYIVHNVEELFKQIVSIN